MDRALSLDLLQLALGEAGNLPSAEELADILAETEAELFRGRQEVPERVLVAAWYLHSVGSALNSLEVYGTARQRAAFQVAGHVFDLALGDASRDEHDRLRLTFAAQVANLRGGLDPNALAAYRWRLGVGDMPVFAAATTSLELGTALLAGDTNWLFPALDRLRRTSRTFEEELGLDLRSTALGPIQGVVEGARRLLIYFVYGREADREAAQSILRGAAVTESGPEDLDSRWVAFHLWQLAGDVGRTALWAILPPDTAPSVARAFTLAKPPVLSLWPPQVELLSRDRTPYAFDPAVRRMVLSVPTSAGKTLVAQVLVADHIVRVGSGVCFVAPTRSLCREIEASLRQRMRLLARAADVRFSDELDSTAVDGEPQVEVMTPERLAYLVRSDPQAVLGRFGLFIFDEAHAVGDPARGWTLEWVLSYLHQATAEMPHRILAMSAAIGNRATLATWLDPTDRGIHFSSDWRGPRRVHAIFTTEKVEASAAELPRPTARSPRRIRYDLTGVLHLRPTSTGRVFELRMRKAVGELVVRQPGNNRDQELSTAFYRTIAPLALILGRAGPVLVISPTKVEARSLAQEIAKKSDAVGPPWLVAVARARLGDDHPLVGCLRKGVAYHHSSLPRDVVLGIEESVVAERLRFVVATTTLTEGVNLPVRTVIITGQGSYGPGGFEEYITGARLLNAIGRAGRAAKESEGWIVLARNARYDRRDFERLAPTEADMPITSVLATAAALEELARLEARAAENADVALIRAGSIAESFLSHIWLIASIAEDLGQDLSGRVDAFLESSLAWLQLTDRDKVRWRRAARRAIVSFVSRRPEQRRRWSRTGISLGSAAVIEEVSQEVAGAWPPDPPESASEALAAILGGGRLERLLSLPEAQLPKLRTHRTGRNTVLDVDALELLHQWVAGESVGDLANRFLGEVPDDEFRQELLADYVSAAFDNFLPWALGIVIDWANAALTPAVGEGGAVPMAVAAYVRYGVDSENAVRLIRAGVPSRSVAAAVARGYAADLGSDLTLREWLCSTEFGEWNERFAASPQDLTALLEFARLPGTRLAARVLDGDEARIPISGYDPQRGDREATLALRPISGDLAPPRLGFYRGQVRVGLVRPEHLAELSALRSTGAPIRIEIDEAAVPPEAIVTLVTVDAD